MVSGVGYASGRKSTCCKAWSASLSGEDVPTIKLVNAGGRVAAATARAGVELGKIKSEVVPESPLLLLHISSTERTAQRPTVMEKLSPPSPVQFSGNLADNWESFRQRFKMYLADSRAGWG